MPKRLGLALLAGAILPFAFAPFGYWWLAILSPALLLWLWDYDRPTKLTPKKASLIGFFYGIGVFGVGISWVFVSIHVYGHSHVLIAFLLTLLLVLLLSSYFAAQGYFLTRWFKGSRLAFWLLGFPTSFVMFEWVRGVFLTGFPWLLLGTSQVDSPLGGFAPIGSVYLVSFMCALLAGCLVTFFKGSLVNKRSLVDKRSLGDKGSLVNRSIAVIIVLASLSTGAILKTIDYTRPFEDPKSVSLVQGNLEPDEKFGTEQPLLAFEKIYGTLTQSEWGQNLIVWPEGALPIPLPYVAPYLDSLETQAKLAHSMLITGVQVNLPRQENTQQTEEDKNPVFYNSLIALGTGQGIYFKEHLLPFGDFLPFENWLRGVVSFFDLPNSSYSSGPAYQTPLKLGSVLLTPVICYEIAFPDLIRRNVLGQSQTPSNAIVILSEDGWFGGSFGPYQHLEIARMRALETGRPIVRSTTRGISAVINEKGKIESQTQLFQKTVLRAFVQPMQGETPWLKIGLLPILLLILFGFFSPRFRS